MTSSIGSMHTIYNVKHSARVCAPTNSLCTLYTMLTVVRGCPRQLMLTSDWLCNNMSYYKNSGKTGCSMNIRRKARNV